MLKYNVNELADALGIDPENVHLLAPFVGGGFGSKLGISHEAVAAALAALGTAFALLCLAFLGRNRAVAIGVELGETRLHRSIEFGAADRLVAIGIGAHVHAAALSVTATTFTAFAAGFVHCGQFGLREAARLVGIGLGEMLGHAGAAVTAAPAATVRAIAAFGPVRLAGFMRSLHFGCGQFAITIGVRLGEHFGAHCRAVVGIEHTIAIGIHTGEALSAGGLHFGQRDAAIAIGVGIFPATVLRDCSSAGQRQHGSGESKEGLVHGLSPKVESCDGPGV